LDWRPLKSDGSVFHIYLDFFMVQGKAGQVANPYFHLFFAENEIEKSTG
jgi:hypothetical protein